MSYSTYMYINNWNDEDKIEKLNLNIVCNIFDECFDIIPNCGYWDTSNDDYIKFSEYMKQNIIDQMDEKNNTTLFIFCNHDGDTDNEVYQSFIMFAKILAYKNPTILIEIFTDANIENNPVCIISRKYGVLIIPETTIEKNKKEFDIELKKYERRVNIEHHKKELQKLRTMVDN